MKNSDIIADLRTAQNRMFSFITEALVKAEESGQIKTLLQDPEMLLQLYKDVRCQLFDLLTLSSDERDDWHLGVIDSGKRAIETLVSYFCPADEQANILVNTENYVAFNKFSAAKALYEQKGVDFAQPFTLAMGKALTRDSNSELQKAKVILLQEKAAVFWLAWNSTSTGVKEKLEELVDFRNKCNSPTLIISDAASLPLFTETWQEIPSDNLPDIFFFSLRKQALPYSGPQDEANQAKNSGAIYIFNSRALSLAEHVNGPSLYHTPRPIEAAQFMITKGVQRENHIRHLLKLQKSISYFLDPKSSRLRSSDLTREAIHEKVCQAFAQSSSLTRLGYKLLADRNVQSETAYIVKAPSQVKPAELIQYMKEEGIQVSISMHPQVPNTSYFRFACYPATSFDEVSLALQSLEKYAMGNEDIKKVS